MNYNMAYENLCKTINILFSDNTALSFPFPQTENGIKEDVYFITKTSFEVERERPFAVIKIAMQDGTLLEYRNCYVNDVVDTDKYPFAKKIDYTFADENMTVDEYKECMERINSLYSRLREFVFDASVSNEDRKTALEYKKLLLATVPKALLPYYEAIGMQFSNWLEQI